MLCVHVMDDVNLQTGFRLLMDAIDFHLLYSFSQTRSKYGVCSVLSINSVLGL